MLRRFPHGKGFTYVYEKSRRTLKSQKTRDWIKSQAIPPAWTDVFIDTNKKAKIYAWGRDAKNRKQYIYNPDWRAKREQKKFDRIIHFADALPAMRKVTGKHLKGQKPGKDRVLACMVRLLENAYFRAGNEHYRVENKTYGLTTLRSKHLDIDGDQLIFEYKGKSGKQQKRTIKNKKLVGVVSQIDDLPGYEIFKYVDKKGHVHGITSDILNDYIKSIMGEDYSAKDFRTWAGTYLAATLLDRSGAKRLKKEKQSHIIKAIDSVAERLGNTRSVARASYIDPRVIERYSSGITLKNYLEEARRETQDLDLMSPEERAVQRLLVD